MLSHYPAGEAMVRKTNQYAHRFNGYHHHLPTDSHQSHSDLGTLVRVAV